MKHTHHSAGCCASNAAGPSTPQESLKKRDDATASQPFTWNTQHSRILRWMHRLADRR